MARGGNIRGFAEWSGQTGVLKGALEHESMGACRMGGAGRGTGLPPRWDVCTFDFAGIGHFGTCAPLMLRASIILGRVCTFDSASIDHFGAIDRFGAHGSLCVCVCWHWSKERVQAPRTSPTRRPRVCPVKLLLWWKARAQRTVTVESQCTTAHTALRRLHCESSGVGGGGGSLGPRSAFVSQRSCAVRSPAAPSACVARGSGPSAPDASGPER